MRKHRPSTGRGACPARAQYPQTNRAPRLKREIVKTRLRVLTGFPQARGRRTRVEAASIQVLSGTGGAKAEPQ